MRHHFRFLLHHYSRLTRRFFSAAFDFFKRPLFFGLLLFLVLISLAALIFYLFPDKHERASLNLDGATDTQSSISLTGLSPAATISASGSPVTAAEEAAAAPILYLGSFGYSPANIDKNNTTLFFNPATLGISFPPDYKWEEIDNKNIASADQAALSSWPFNEFSGPYADRRCVGSDCLEQKGLSLSYNKKALTLPAEIRTADLAALSIAALDTKWLVGFTLRERADSEKSYRGLIYYFDGRNFSPINTPAPIVSEYFGLFGFGGRDEDFLAVYGAYQGLAYRIQRDRLTDISQFFNIKTMDGGFKAEIIRTVNGRHVNWYVFSATTGHPHLLKLWSNTTEDIAGILVFPNIFSSENLQSALRLKSSDQNKNEFIVYLKNGNGRETWRLFSDYGFKNTAAASLQTLPLSAGNNNETVNIHSLVANQFVIDEDSRPSVRWLFSTNQQDWRDIPAGAAADFFVPNVQTYLLRLVFPATRDRFLSPFISFIAFNYQFEKLGDSVPTTISSASEQAPSISVPAVVSGQSTEPASPISPASAPLDINKQAEPEAATPAENSASIPDGALRLNVSSSGFSPRRLAVKSGQAVTIWLSSGDTMPHVFLFTDSRLANLTTTVLGGENKLVNFIAPAAGTYNFRDNIPIFRANVGELVVSD